MKTVFNRKDNRTIIYLCVFHWRAFSREKAVTFILPRDCSRRVCPSVSPLESAWSLWCREQQNRVLTHHLIHGSIGHTISFCRQILLFKYFLVCHQDTHKYFQTENKNKTPPPTTKIIWPHSWASKRKKKKQTNNTTGYGHSTKTTSETKFCPKPCILLMQIFGKLYALEKINHQGIDFKKKKMYMERSGCFLEISVAK